MPKTSRGEDGVGGSSKTSPWYCLLQEPAAPARAHLLSTVIWCRSSGSAATAILPSYRNRSPTVNVCVWFSRSAGFFVSPSPLLRSCFAPSSTHSQRTNHHHSHVTYISAQSSHTPRSTIPFLIVPLIVSLIMCLIMSLTLLQFHTARRCLHPTSLAFTSCSLHEPRQAP
jgi:hypothetical protein